MRIYIQNVQTKLFYAGGKQWTEDATAAHAFDDVSGAVAFCGNASKTDPTAQLIIHFRQPASAAKPQTPKVKQEQD